MKPHKHAEIIKAWADGAEIEFYDTRFDKPCWKLCGNPPLWHEEYQYRIKPEPKPDVVNLYFVQPAGLYPSNKQYKHNLILTFDGETGKLKSAEVME